MQPTFNAGCILEIDPMLDHIKKAHIPEGRNKLLNNFIIAFGKAYMGNSGACWSIGLAINSSDKDPSRRGFLTYPAAATSRTCPTITSTANLSSGDMLMVDSIGNSELY